MFCVLCSVLSLGSVLKSQHYAAEASKVKSKVQSPKSKVLFSVKKRKENEKEKEDNENGRQEKRKSGKK